MRPMRETRTLTLRFEARDWSAIETELMATEGRYSLEGLLEQWIRDALDIGRMKREGRLPSQG